ncbi:MAG: General secretion pathway protein GspG [uncultured Sulfurovum sp.]|uniref:Type II secretion system core protein G n=1 Tax=uncultured Sulfurovum sp. TaxID=269237 RepID=A0A6S6TZ22_9BACT|nr:MAG: General secretion pathway protein GspG [uncultured Sulfurovum sp.]
MTHKIELKKEKLTLSLINKINQKQYTTAKKGFSLLELLVVILILGILAAAVVPKVVGAGDKAKVDLVCVNMKGAANALKMFKLDNGMYPETEEGFEALQANPDSDKYANYAPSAYLEKLPKDSWGAKMVYMKTGNTFDIISYGADRREGGTDEYSDIKYSGCK